jgi:hypothetical protein
MSASAAKVAPKTFTQTKNVLQIFTMWLGGSYGYAEKKANDQLWMDHHRERWSKSAKEADEKHKAATAHLPKSSVPEIIPEAFHGLYKEVTEAH